MREGRAWVRLWQRKASQKKRSAARGNKERRGRLERQAKTVESQQQVAWMRWEGAQDRRVTCLKGRLKQHPLPVKGSLQCIATPCKPAHLEHCWKVKLHTLWNKRNSATPTILHFSRANTGGDIFKSCLHSQINWRRPQPEKDQTYAKVHKNDHVTLTLDVNKNGDFEGASCSLLEKDQNLFHNKANKVIKRGKTYIWLWFSGEHEVP